MRARTALATAALLTVPLLAACGSRGSTDCATAAHAIAGETRALTAAIGTAHQDPHDAATALRRIQLHLDEIAGHTDGNPAATRAIAALSLAVSNAKNDLDNGVRDPDVSPVTRAAARLSDACPTKE